MNKIRMYYDIINGWIIDVNYSLKKFEVEQIVDYTLNKQKDRIISMPSGFKKDEAIKALDILRIGRSSVVKQNFIADVYEKELYLNENRRRK